MRASCRLLACLLLSAVLPAGLLVSGRASAQAPVLKEGDRLVLLGGGLAYGMQQDGWLETLLQARRPELRLSLRNLGFPADEVSVQQRTAGFGDWDDWLARAQADVVLACFGFAESFAGEPGLPAFHRDLAALVEHLRGRRYGRETARVVLLTPAGFDALPGFGPDQATTDARLGLYAQVVRDVAREQGVPCIDLFAATQTLRGAGRLQRDGLHFTDFGAQLAADVIAGALGAPLRGDEDPARLAELRTRILAKDRLWFDVYQATDGNNIYGSRGPLEYDGVTNATVLQRELEVYEVRADNADRAIHALARGGASEPARAEPPLQPVATNRKGDAPDGRFSFLGGEEAIARMTPGDGLRIQLFASEERFPELAKPVQMSFDTRGRLWVACWPSYPHDGPAEPRADRLLILTDLDGDGAADEAHAFADDLHNPTGFEFWEGGVFVAQAPDLLFLKDTDGDDVADVRQVVLSGLSSADTHHTANSFVIGPDGALYFQEGVFHQSQIETAWGPVRNHDACVWRYEPRTGRLQRAAPYGFLNPHGHVFDRWGEDLITDGTTNENFLAAPLATRVDFPGRHPGYFTIFAQRSRPAGGTELLSSTAFPPEFQGNLLIANVIGFQGVFRYRLDADGSGLRGTEEQPLLFSSDPNFRPVDLEVGPDGAVYVLDWQTPLIGHMQHHLRDPNRDHVHGRVYRVSCEALPTREPVAIAGRPVPELLDLLKDPDNRVRYRARIELSAHDPAEVGISARLWEQRLDPDDPDVEHQRLEALWLLQQGGVVSEALLSRVLASPEPLARAAAVRVLRQVRDQVHDALLLLAPAVGDADPRVRLEALVALSWFPEPHAAELALRVLGQPTDRFLDYTLVECMRALQPQWRAALVAGEPFAQDDPAGLAWCLARLDTADLALLRPSAALDAERLSRHGLEPADYALAAANLASARNSSRNDELLAAIRHADERGGEHVDHLLSGLFAALPSEVDAALAGPLRQLSAEARRASTRRLATAARLRAPGALDAAWAETESDAAARLALLQAVPLLEPELQEQILPKLLAALEAAPAPSGADGDSAGGVPGRFVRVELPGPARTLTLAEVQAWSQGDNVALDGQASQSSTAWNGVAERAIDGNTSGAFGDDGQTHTREDQPEPWWELDLGRSQPLDAIELWNRTEEGGRFAARLAPWVVRVLDEQRREVWQAHGEQVPSPSLRLELATEEQRVRGETVRALGALAAAGVGSAEIGSALATHLPDEALRAELLAALVAVPAERLGDFAVGSAADWLLAAFDTWPEEAWSTSEGRDALALADALLPRLAGRDPIHARRLELARRGHGPQVLVLRPVPDSLQFDRRELTVATGRPVELVFQNTDIMPHNLVLAASGALALVGTAGEALLARPDDAAARGWVPDLPEVLAATRLLQPGESQTLRWQAPAAPGDFPYLCTFPGHWVRMNGVLHVVASAEAALAQAAPPVAPATAPSRSFVRSWTPEDFRDGLDAHADATRGREVLAAASCLKCHAIDGEGGRTGPDLRTVAVGRDRAALLQQVLQPSALLAKGYESQIFFLHQGGVVSGRVLAEDAEGADVLDDPYSGQPRRVLFADVEERRASEISVMPEGLLSTFARQDVLDLLAFLESLRPETAASPASPSR